MGEVKRDCDLVNGQPQSHQHLIFQVVASRASANAVSSPSREITVPHTSQITADELMVWLCALEQNQQLPLVSTLFSLCLKGRWKHWDFLF